MTTALLIIGYIIMGFVISACTYVYYRSKFDIEYRTDRDKKGRYSQNKACDDDMWITVFGIFWPIAIAGVLSVLVVKGILYITITLSIKSINKISDKLTRFMCRKEIQAEQADNFMEM